MSLHFGIIYVTVILLAVFFNSWSCGSELPSFRIVAPQTICKTSNNGTSNHHAEVISIGFQPRDGIKLLYKVRIFFKSIGNQANTQRKTLLIWKSVRALEKRINFKELFSISESNMCSISKAEVVSGVVYIFYIVGITDAGETSKEQTFEIKYTDGVLKRDSVSDEINFLLIGTENTVASISYVISARVSFCSPRYDYYIRWKMYNLDEEFQEILHTSATVLKIPPKSLTAGKDYRIEASVLQSNNSEILAKDYIAIEVLKRGFQAFIIPTASKIGLNKPVILEVYITDFDNNYDSLEILWKCTPTNHNGNCEKGAIINQTKFEIIFKAHGSYQITASVKLGEIRKSVTAVILVDPNVYVSYEFSHIPSLVVAAGQSVHFTALILDLIPNCKAGWSSAQEEGFLYIGPDEMEPNGFGAIAIKDLEQNYLSEIAEFGNSTINREIILNIPKANNVGNDGWQGLRGDSNYKFRLDTVCPEPYMKSATESGRHTVVSSFEFVIHTNSPPIGGAIQIKPKNGTALRTVFEVSIESARDLLMDSPLSYEFLALVEKYTLSLGTFYEFKSLDTQLPFTETPVQLHVRVCDIRQACNTVKGPSIQMEYEDFSQQEFESQIIRITEAFKRTDYDEGQNMILMMAVTYKNGNRELFKIFRDFAIELLVKELDKQHERPSEKYYISKEDIVRFILQTKINFNILGMNDPATLEKLLDLLDQTADDEESKANTHQSASENIAENFRTKRDASDILSDLPETRSIVDADYVRMHLNLIEQILKSHSKEDLLRQKPKIAQRITMLTGKMCRSEQIIKESIYSPIASVDLEKMSGNHLLEKNFTIPNYFTATAGFFTITMPQLKSRQNYYCVALIQYPGDYFSGEEGILVNVQIFDLKTFQPLRPGPGPGGASKREAITLILPKDEESQNSCLMRSDGKWSQEFCHSKTYSLTHLICGCSQFGYFKLSTKKLSPLTTSTGFGFSSAPTKNITRFHNDNRIHSTTTDLTIVTKRTDVSLTSMMTKPTTRATTVRSTERRSNDFARKDYKAAALNYAIPFILIPLLLVIVIGLIYYRRRKRNLQTNINGLDQIMEIEPRESRPGIKYAKFYDEHLMTGNFNTDLSN